MNKKFETRREFLRNASLTALAFPLLINCKSSTLAQKQTDEDVLSLIRKNARPKGTEGMGAVDFPKDVSSKTVLKPKDENFVPIVISGTVYKSDGKTPAPDILIYFYHTDVEGIYGRSGEHKHGHYRGWLLTDDKGRYELSTIKPASYPDSTISSHIHTTITGKDFREDWIDSILFEGDKFITERERSRAGKRGGFNPILEFEKRSDGILYGVRDIQL